MSSLLQFIYDYIDFSLVALLITVYITAYSLVRGFGVELSRKVIKRAILVFLGIFLLVNHLNFTTFEKIFSKKINEDTEIRSLTINMSDEDLKSSFTIDDQEAIKRILADLENLKLKRVTTETINSNRSFGLTFDIRNLTELNYYLAENYTIFVSEEYLNGYKILGKPNHLTTLNELVEEF